MENQVTQDICELKSVLLRQTVENILLSIESKAEANEKSAESSELKFL